jgi:cytoplasmic FMR1 interacting protein
LPNAELLSEEMQQLQMFLCNPNRARNYIMWCLKTELSKISGHQEVMIALTDHCADALEQGMYLLPVEKHALYRAILQIIYLLDKPEFDVFDKLKNLSRLQKLYRSMPVMYLYGDMHLSIEFILQECHNWDADMLSDWVPSRSAKIEGLFSIWCVHLYYLALDCLCCAESYLLRYHADDHRIKFMRYTAQLAQLVNSVTARQEHAQVSTMTPEFAAELYKNVIDGFRLLGELSSNLIEQTAWKYAHACPEHEYKDKGGKGERGHEYEKAVRFNYSKEDLNATVAVISMIKSLGSQLVAAESQLLPMLHRHMHDQFQDFVQTHLARPLRKAFKAKRPSEGRMMELRAIAGDWQSFEFVEDYKSKKDDIEKMIRDFPRRPVPPTASQVALTRRMMHSVYDSRAEGMQGGFFTEKDLKDEWVTQWAAFYKEFFFYHYLLDYTKVVSELADTSYLWFREFYLELTKCIQFPIAMSVPWMLTEYVIDQAPHLMVQSLFMMDIYNDSAEHALSVFGQRFLYDEIEAETNLSFDQLVYLLSERIFVHFKDQAAYILFDKDLKDGLRDIRRGVPEMNNTGGFAQLMSQRNIMLMGRSVDLHEVLSQHVSAFMRKNIDLILAKFESSDICALVETQKLMANARLAHELMSQHLRLDPFDDILREMNDDVSVGAIRGRLVMHIFTQLTTDLFPNFNYNGATRRFVRRPETPVLGMTEPERESAPKGVAPYYWYGKQLTKQCEAVAKLSKTFFGAPHLEAMMELLGARDLPLLIDEVIGCIESKLAEDVSAYFAAILEALPPMKLPSLQVCDFLHVRSDALDDNPSFFFFFCYIQFGVVGAFGFFELKLKYVASYAPLRSSVFQAMREIGNAFCLLQLFEQALDLEDDIRFSTVAHLLGVKCAPKTVVSADSNDAALLMSSAAGCSPLATIFGNAAHALSQRPVSLAAESQVASSAREQYAVAVKAIALNIESSSSWQPPFARGSLLTAAMHRLYNFISPALRQELSGPLAANGVMDVESSRDFSRFWSVLQLIFCMPSKEMLAGQDMSNMAMFGEGWCWAGCLVLHLLSLRHRFDALDFCQFISRAHAMFPPEDPKQRKEPAPVCDPINCHILQWLTFSLGLFFVLFVSQKSPQEEMQPSLDFLLAEAAVCQQLNSSIFACLESHLPTPPKKHVQFHPFVAQEAKMSTEAFGPR